MRPLHARLLINRGVTDSASAEKYLNPRYEGLSDPLALPGMEAAVARIAAAISGGERIGVVGDFDVDGLTAAALLARTLESLGGLIATYIPSRVLDGHGLPRNGIDSLKSRGVSVLVTADTGVSDVEEVDYARASGIECVITDHHLPQSGMPRACALVNPHLPGTLPEAAFLTGAGVAFRLAQAVARRLPAGAPAAPGGAADALALAALGTVADVAPLTGDNRIIVAQGLRALGRTRHAGLLSLLARVKVNGGPRQVDTETVAFQIAPRLNAPGRLGDARPAFDLLTCDDAVAAGSLAAKIDAWNTERRRLSSRAWDIAMAQLAALDELPPVVSVASDELLPGILGPLAGRLSEAYRRPAIAAALDGGLARASARSVPGFDIHAALVANEGLLSRHGGHARAAGFALPAGHLDELMGRLGERAAAISPAHDVPAVPAVTADAEVGLEDLDRQLWSFVDRMAPFGEGNPAPLFLTRGLMPVQVAAVGAGGEHMRLVLEAPAPPAGRARSMQAVGFRLGDADLGTGRVDVVYALRNSYWRGRNRQELELKAIRPAQERR